MNGIAIHGSNGEVMAPFGPQGEFIRGKPGKIKVTSFKLNDDAPLEVRQQLVGLEIPTMFTDDQLVVAGYPRNELPKNCHAAYARMVIKALNDKGTPEARRAAGTLQILCGDELDLYIFEDGTYEILKS